MPSHEEHCRQSFERYGKRFDELHTWMDEPSAIMGRSHRMYRHDPYRTPKEALERFGHMADHACLDHIKLDHQKKKKETVTPHFKYIHPEVLALSALVSIIVGIIGWILLTTFEVRSTPPYLFYPHADEGLIILLFSILLFFLSVLLFGKRTLVNASTEEKGSSTPEPSADELDKEVLKTFEKLGIETKGKTLDELGIEINKVSKTMDEVKKTFKNINITSRTEEKRRERGKLMKRYITGDIGKLARLGLTLTAVCPKCGEKFDAKLKSCPKCRGVTFCLNCERWYYGKSCPKCGLGLASSTNEQKKDDDSKGEESVTCLHCGLEYEDDQEICPYCGATLVVLASLYDEG